MRSTRSDPRRDRIVTASGRRQPEHARPRGFIDEWKPRRPTLQLIEQVEAVLDEYSDYLPLTIRQVFYRLVHPRVS